VVREMHLEATAPCDASCADSIDLATANRLTAEIDRRARELRARGAKAILVDVTRNGGGSNWVEAPPNPEPRPAVGAAPRVPQAPALDAATGAKAQGRRSRLAGRARSSRFAPGGSCAPAARHRRDARAVRSRRRLA